MTQFETCYLVDAFDYNYINDFFGEKQLQKFQD